jgi:ribonucleoside-diphosphate reductase alpha chain
LAVLPRLGIRGSLSGNVGDRTVSSYIIVGLYSDGTPGELFLKVNKAGSTMAGLMNTIAIAVSTGLQHGVPLGFFVDKFSHVCFEPSGWTGNHRIPYAKSLVDYVFQWLGQQFLGREQPAEPGIMEL